MHSTNFILSFVLSMREYQKPSTFIKHYNLKVMKTNTTTLINPLSKTVLRQLASEVKETIATGFQAVPVKTFCTADLWNIQRNQRTSIARRRFF